MLSEARSSPVIWRGFLRPALFSHTLINAGVVHHLSHHIYAILMHWLKLIGLSKGASNLCLVENGVCLPHPSSDEPFSSSCTCSFGQGGRRSTWTLLLTRGSISSPVCQKSWCSQRWLFFYVLGFRLVIHITSLQASLVLKLHCVYQMPMELL